MKSRSLYLSHFICGILFVCVHILSKFFLLLVKNCWFINTMQSSSWNFIIPLSYIYIERHQMKIHCQIENYMGKAGVHQKSMNAVTSFFSLSFGNDCNQVTETGVRMLSMLVEPQKSSWNEKCVHKYASTIMHTLIYRNKIACKSFT